jgi:hypothetical protein
LMSGRQKLLQPSPNGCPGHPGRAGRRSWECRTPQHHCIIGLLGPESANHRRLPVKVQRLGDLCHRVGHRRRVDRLDTTVGSAGRASTIVTDYLTGFARCQWLSSSQRSWPTGPRGAAQWVGMESSWPVATGSLAIHSIVGYTSSPSPRNIRQMDPDGVRIK